MTLGHANLPIVLRLPHIFFFHVTGLLLAPPPPLAAPSPLGLHLLFIYTYNHAHVERTATVGLQAKTALAMPDIAHRKREFSPNIFS
jgi:hypothetical protein